MGEEVFVLWCFVLNWPHILQLPRQSRQRGLQLTWRRRKSSRKTTLSWFWSKPPTSAVYKRDFEMLTAAKCMNAEKCLQHVIPAFEGSFYIMKIEEIFLLVDNLQIFGASLPTKCFPKIPPLRWKIHQATLVPRPLPRAGLHDQGVMKYDTNRNNAPFFVRKIHNRNGNI